MSLSLGTDLWDKPDAVVAFNENNTIIVEKLQKGFGDFCKSQLTNTGAQKRLFEKFLSENEALKTSEFTFSLYAYFLSEQVFDIINAQETFSNAFLNEVDEIIKAKSANIRKESRIMKHDKKKMLDDLSKENHKLDHDFKRYRNRFNAREAAHLASMKAEENKALSRNQVDNYESIYLNRKVQYEESRTDYLKTLENFNNYQARFYTTLIGEWGLRAQKIENERYTVMKATFTNMAELCKSVASKFNEIADRIESKIDSIDCEKDCLTLINQEKTSDVPPRDVPFQDFDIQEKNELCLNEARSSKISNSGSDSTSSNNGNNNKTSSIAEIKRKSRSLSLNIAKENGSIINGISTSGSKLFGKLFGGSKKTKDSSAQVIQSEIKQLESLLEEKCAQGERTDTSDQDINDIKNTLETLKNCQKPVLRSQTMLGANKERVEVQDVHSKSIEVLRCPGTVEIVSTPAEAMAIVARSSYVIEPDKDPNDKADNVDSIPNNVNIIVTTPEKKYEYYYEGSCVAMHGYQSTDPSTMYLSFDIGDQFYIIHEAQRDVNCGWLLVERIDRTESGYVPTSYMDARHFDNLVKMFSGHVMLTR